VPVYGKPIHPFYPAPALPNIYHSILLLLGIVPEALSEWQFSLIGVSATPRVQLGRAAGSALGGALACEIGGLWSIYTQAVCHVEYSSRV
jgi:hypothetical protein